MTPGDCERLRELAAELALGIADGEERAWALEHLVDCAACRVELDRFATVADEVLLLAPAAEPPAGFEGRVAEAPSPPPRRRRSLARRLAIPALAAGAAAVIAAVVVWFALGDDRDLADSYRDTLAVANGEYFEAAPMEAPGNQRVGYVYGYQGRASWVLAVIYDGVANGRYRLQGVANDGRRVRLRGIEITDGRGSAGGVTPVPYEKLSQLRVLDAHGREIAEADLHG
jgi:hypothetical protein